MRSYRFISSAMSMNCFSWKLVHLVICIHDARIIIPSFVEFYISCYRIPDRNGILAVSFHGHMTASAKESNVKH